MNKTLLAKEFLIVLCVSFLSSIAGFGFSYALGNAIIVGFMVYSLLDREGL